MSDFDDLPDPKTIWHKDDAALSRWFQFIKEVEPLFVEIAMKLRDLEPPCEIVISKKEVWEGNWFTGKKSRIILFTKHGWEIGWIDGNAEIPRKSYLLPDGSIYPDTASGLQALFGGVPGSLGVPCVRDPATMSNTRSLIIEGLKKKYIYWCQLSKNKR